MASSQTAKPHPNLGQKKGASNLEAPLMLSSMLSLVLSLVPLVVKVFRGEGFSF